MKAKAQKQLRSYVAHWEPWYHIKTWEWWGDKAELTEHRRQNTYYYMESFPDDYIHIYVWNHHPVSQWLVYLHLHNMHRSQAKPMWVFKIEGSDDFASMTYSSKSDCSNWITNVGKLA